MSKFNKTKEPTRPTEINQMGEPAYKLDPREELCTTVLTTFLQNSYYEKEDETVTRIINAMKQTNPLFVAQLAIYARREANMRSVSHLLAGELTDSISGQEWADRFYEKIVVRPDDISEILAYMFSKKGKSLRAAVKRGFRNRVSQFDAYQLDKYQMKSKDISMIDIINLLHPKPTKKNEVAFKRLMNGESLSDLYESKVWEKEVSKAGQEAKDPTQRKESVDNAMRDVIDTNVENMPMMNLVRNLRNILQRTPDKVDTIVNIIKNDDKILKSRLLPYRFSMAYEEVSKVAVAPVSRSKVTFEDEQPTVLTQTNVQKVLEALEYATEVSCRNIPKLQGRVAILIDHSGSMRGDGGGHSLVSAMSKVTSSMIANLFGTMLMKHQDNVFMGLFGDRLITIPAIELDRTKGVLELAKDIHNKGQKCGPGSEQGIFEFFNDVIANKTRVDHVFVFSDQVIGNGNSWYPNYGYTGKYGRGKFDQLFREFRKVNPSANVVSVDIRNAQGTTVFNKDLRVTQMSGWSNKIFDLLESFSVGYKDLIKKIESIKI